MSGSAPWSGAVQTGSRNLRWLGGGDRTSKLWLAYSVMGILLLAYLGWLISGNRSTLIDGWGVSAFEVLGGALCIASGLVRRTARWVPIILGAALMAWALGRLTVTIETLGGARPPEVAVYDAFYLSFYPLAYVALVLYLRGEVRRLATPNWLDGMIAGLGATALCAAFAFHAVARLTGKTVLATAVNLAYPVGDVLLLLLVVGGVTVLSGRDRRPWLVVASGIALIVVGDTFNLFQSSASPSRLGVVLISIAWPAAIYLMSRAMWLPRVQSDPRAFRKPTGFLLPGLAATCGLVILFVGTLKGVDGVAVGLATATLVLVGARMASSVRAMRSLTQERQRLSVTDHLTGLGNRRYLFDVLDGFFAEEEAAQPQRSLAFLFIDLEHFKKINDSFGHPAGDEILRQLGARLARSLEPGDLVARIGGDEFGAVLMDADADYAAGVAERISASLEQPFELEPVRAQIGANIGIALAPADASDSTGLILCADVAMYRAKFGGTPCALYEQGFEEGGDRLHLAEELRAAVDAGELVLYYQPQLDLRSGEISAIEALVRWPHPALGLIPPLKFLPLAEEAGLIGMVTRLVLTRAIEQCAAWRAAGQDLSVSVNVSATDLLDPRLIEVIGGLLEQHGLPASCLVVEITETGVITEFERSKGVVADLRDLGVSVSIDDFGAGFTSLAYLSSLAVGELKLDRALIAALSSVDRREDVELVRATIALGHALRLRVVAEGIEDKATLELVSELGCDLGQGFFIGKPRPAHELAFGPSSACTPAALPATPRGDRKSRQLVPAGSVQAAGSGRRVPQAT
jgi:diguanylate cyclase (GGDEF)-like protein